MSLPDCRDIGGEEPAGDGFCPVELFIPRYRSETLKFLRDGSVRENWRFESRAENLADKLEPFHHTTFGPWTGLDIGFVAGCLWGDDSSWKLQVFDLSRAAEGILTRDDRFGYVEIAAGLPLAAAVQVERRLPGLLRVRLFREETRDIATGKRIHHYDDDLLIDDIVR
ncbi:MAG TPA: hypothetical protein VHZ78_00990 [Rhizomicrobium sp.]|jgi:hypothetical protein|nr:hypothetical protein [Rhizomicrobium sp.]